MHKEIRPSISGHNTYCKQIWESWLISLLKWFINNPKILGKIGSFTKPVSVNPSSPISERTPHLFPYSHILYLPQ